MTAIFGEGVGYVPCPDAGEVYANEAGTELGRNSYFVAGPCGCWEDTFERTVAPNEWGISDPGDPWTVYIYDSHDEGAVTAGYGYLRNDVSGLAITNAALEFSTPVPGITEVLNGEAWTMTAAITFRRTNSGTFAITQAIFDPGGPRIEIEADWQSTFGTDHINVRLHEDTTQDAVGVVSPAYDDPIFVKWEHSMTSGIGRVKVWRQADPEPAGWTLSDAVSDLRPFDFRFLLQHDLEQLDGTTGEYAELQIADLMFCE